MYKGRRDLECGGWRRNYFHNPQIPAKGKYCWPLKFNIQFEFKYKQNQLSTQTLRILFYFLIEQNEIERGGLKLFFVLKLLFLFFFFSSKLTIYLKYVNHISKIHL